MKRISIFWIPMVFVVATYSQELDSLIYILEKQKGVSNYSARENPDSSEAQSIEDLSVVVQDQPDTTNIRIGNREISIIEKEKNSEVNVQRNEGRRRLYSGKFRGHWAGFEWGLNNFLDDECTISREGDDEFMDINTGRSWVINLNVAQYSLGFGTSHAGIVTGLGLEFSNYFFDEDLTIEEISGEIQAIDLSGQNITKSKLSTTYIRAPLIFEVQFPGTFRSRRVFLSAGIVGSLKLGAHTKVVYKEDDDKEKVKNRDDFNINPFRYGITSRLGIGNIGVFFDYYFTPFYIDGKGPELNPFSAGLSLTF